MAYGAGYVAAVAAGATVVDPRPGAGRELRRVFAAYPHIGPVLPAVGYDRGQLLALEQAIDAAEADLVVSGTPVDLGRLLQTNKRIVRARYDLAEIGEPNLSALVDAFIDRTGRAGGR
jgi:predicted GTPase